MRAALLALAIAAAACGKSDAPVPAGSAAASPAPAPAAGCDALRDKYLAWEAARVHSALADVHDHVAEMQAEADKEAAQAKVRFAGVCAEMGSALDPSCFEHAGYDSDRAHKKHCDDVVHALDVKLNAR
jgi:hypothetical protein